MNKPERKARRQEIIKALEQRNIIKNEEGTRIHDMVDNELFNFYNQLEL